MKATQGNEGKLKVMFDEDNYQMYLDLCRASGLPYTVTRSNYTLDIESKFCSIYFMTNVMSKKSFWVGAMVKKDIIDSKTVQPVIDKHDLKYFAFNIAKVLHDNSGTEIYNIDIKSAYANALNNNKLLTPKTFNFLCTLAKKDRLAAIGMLASKKDIFTYDCQDNCIGHDKLIKDTESWFYFCVKEIQDVMQECQKEIGSDFLFYWVDGIFYRNAENKKIITDILTARGYNYSYDVCADFLYYENINTKYLSFKKDGKQKIMHLPKLNKEVETYLLKHLKLIK